MQLKQIFLLLKNKIFKKKQINANQGYVKEVGLQFTFLLLF